jgi:NADH-quinone oxidoreductase subunit L
MVTAGVFLVARFSPLFEYSPFALMIICLFGATTAFVAATIGMTQFDIKRVIAYSTMSQLGYMFFALGVSAYSAAMFHLMTHAFFKALLFLGAGSVIHAMSDEQDMRKMGGIWKQIPVTYMLMWIGSLALAGIPFFAGYYSKDMILEAAFADSTWFGNYAYWMGIAAAFMTAFYSWRLIIMTFHGQPRADEKVMAHIHESPNVMIFPLIILAVGSILAGSVFYNGFVGSSHHDGSHTYQSTDHVEYTPWDKEKFWGDSLFVLHENDTVEAAHNVPMWVKKLPIIVGAIGIFLAFIIYVLKEGLTSKLVVIFKPLHRLFYNKWFFDEIYNFLFVKNAFRIGSIFSSTGDRKIIDGLGPDGMSKLSVFIGNRFGVLQSGYLYHYAFVMIVGLILFISWFFWKLMFG